MDNRIKFDERYVCEECGTTTLYFIAPREMLKTMMTKDYPEAVSMEISIEFPTKHIEANYASVCVSPTRKNECGTEDYDLHDVDLPYSEIDELILLAEKEGN